CVDSVDRLPDGTSFDVHGGDRTGEGRDGAGQAVRPGPYLVKFLRPHGGDVATAAMDPRTKWRGRMPTAPRAWRTCASPARAASGPRAAQAREGPAARPAR